ncbi:MAG: hypothetical protein SF053_20190 [Bacteroidia bacterium]|nr:hypothetical protein [Bacteroidia bacterium]
MEIIVLCIAAVLLAGGGWWIYQRGQTFLQDEVRHQKLAQQLGVQLAWQSLREYTIFGTYRGYQIAIQPVIYPVAGMSRLWMGTRILLPMINPNRRALRISRHLVEHRVLERIAPLDKPLYFSHQIAPWLEITTNDMMFSSLILSEEIKITLYEVFSRLEAGVACIYDEELCFVMPGLIRHEEAADLCLRALNLLCDIKDELN